MKFVPHREKDGGPIINWIADQVNRFGCWLIYITNEYALNYVVEFEDEDE